MYIEKNFIYKKIRKKKKKYIFITYAQNNDFSNYAGEKTLDYNVHKRKVFQVLLLHSFSLNFNIKYTYI